jgi:hypothetical protein
LESVVIDDLDVFSRTVRKLQQVRTLYKAKLGIDSLDTGVSAVGNDGVGADVVIAKDSIAFPGDLYWEDILSWRAAGPLESTYLV